MEGFDGTLNRVGRAVWTVWGYITGAVERYLRPEVRNEEAQNVHHKQEDTVPIIQSYKELKVKEEEQENLEIKTSEKETREYLQYSGFSVQAAAVQWEKGNIAHDCHEVKVKSKHTYISSEGKDKKSSMKKDNEKMLDDKSRLSKTYVNQFTEQDDSAAYSNADEKKQDLTFFESEEAELNVETEVTNQEFTRKLEEKEKFTRIRKDEYEAELIKSEFIEQDTDLNVEGSEIGEKQRGKEEDEQECVDQTFRKEFEDTLKEEIKCNSSEEGLPTKESDLKFEGDENHQEQKSQSKEEDINEALGKKYNENELIKSEFIDQDLLVKEADPKVEISENSQEPRRTKKEEEKGVDKIKKGDKDETGQEPHKCEFLDLGLLTKKDYLNVDEIKNKQEQRIKQEEKGVAVTMKRENDKSKEEPIASESINQGSTKKVDLNVECRENNEEQGKKLEKEGVEIMRIENKDTEENATQNEFIAQSLMAEEAELTVEKDENSQEQKRKSQKKEEEETLRREQDETEDLVKSKFPDQDKVTKEADLNVERSRNSQEQKRKKKEECVEIMRDKDETEEELTEDADLYVERSKANQDQTKKAEEGVTIMKKDNDETVKKPIICEFTDQTLRKEDGVNVSRSKNNQDQKNNPNEKEGVIEQIKRENNKSVEEPIASESIDQGLLTKKVDLDVKLAENNQKHITKEEHEDVEIREPEKELIERLLTKEADLRIENHQEHTKKTGEEEEGIAEIIKKEHDDVGEEPVKKEFTAQSLLNKESDLNVKSDENSREQKRKQEQQEECIEITKRENNESEEEPIKSEFIDLCLLAKEATVSVEKSETAQEQTKKVEDVEGVDKIMRTENDYMFKSEFIDHGLLTKETDLHEKRSKSNQVEIREPEEKKKGVQIMRENDATGEKLLKREFTSQGLLKREDDQEQKIKQEEEEDHVEIMRRENNKSEDPGLLAIRNELNMEEQSNYATTEHENEASKSQTVDKALFIQLASTWEERDPFQQSPLNQSLQPLIEIHENATLQNITSEVALNIDSRQLVDTAEKNSHKTAIMTKQELEIVNTRPETGTENQTETVETTSQFRAEVAAVDVKKSAKRDNSLHERPVDRNNVAVQEITGQCFIKQESLLKQSPDTRITELTSHKAPFSEIEFLSLEQVEEAAAVSLDAIQGSSLQKLDESSSEAEVEAQLSSSEQTAEVFEMLSEVRGMSKQAQPTCKVSPVENTYDKLIVETILEDQINQKFTAQYSATEASSLSKASYLLEIASEQKTLDLQTDSQKDTEEQERTVSADPGLLDEIKDVTPCLGVEEQITWISGLRKDAEDTDWELLREREASKRKRGSTNKLESHKETSETNIDVELQNATRESEKELEAEMTDFTTILVSTGCEVESIKKPEKPILLEKEKVGHGESVMDMEERGRSQLKRGLEKISEDRDEDKPSVLTDLLLPSQESSLDFTFQKSKITVKNPLTRPPKDPRTLINMASVEPLTPHPSQSRFLKKSHIESAPVPGKGVIGFKLPGLDSGFPALRKSEAGRKIRDGEDSESVTSQTSNSGLRSADDNVKQETFPSKPKWTPPRKPGMGSPLMMAELKSKLKKPAEE